MAKTYLEAHGDRPNPPTVVLMDASSSVGGTWAQERLYSGLKTNNMVGSYEFSDFPLQPEDYGLYLGQHIPGHIVHRYLSDFADHYGLSRRIRFQTKVTEATLQDNGSWLIAYISEGDNHEIAGKLIAHKLAVATGLTSAPRAPIFPGQGLFRGHIFHSRHLRDRTEDLIASRTVLVVGANKSAWDASYTAARAGAARVHMLVRPPSAGGGGPSWVWRPHRLGFLAVSRLSATRFCSWFDPGGSFFGGGEPWMVRVLRCSWLGRLLCAWFWGFLDFCVLACCGYNDDDDTSVLKEVRPWSSTFWMGNSLSIHNYETDWFDLVRRRDLTVHHAEIELLDSSRAHLSDGTVVEADAIVVCTGWTNKCTISFGPSDVAAALGLPGLTKKKGHESSSDDAILRVKARQEVAQKHPQLLSTPVRSLLITGKDSPPPKRGDLLTNEAGTSDNFLTLYHAMVSPSRRILDLHNLVFLGMHQSVHTVVVAQAQALWATAFFHGRVSSLQKKSAEQIRYAAHVEAEYERLRRPKEGGGAGGQYLDLVFDTLPYVDALLKELGVKTRRKKSWLAEVFVPYTVRDYRGLVREWADS